MGAVLTLQSGHLAKISSSGKAKARLLLLRQEKRERRHLLPPFQPGLGASGLPVHNEDSSLVDQPTCELSPLRTLDNPGDIPMRFGDHDDVMQHIIAGSHVVDGVLQSVAGLERGRVLVLVLLDSVGEGNSWPPGCAT